MNPFAAISWSWRAWRARSITFAVLFAFSLIGVSVIGALRHLLREVGAPWFVWLVVPFVAVVVLARKEVEWMPDPEERRKWALRIVLGAIAAAVVIAKLAPRSEAEPLAAPPVHSGGRADPHAR
ncbi:MAG: hypothetical protein ABIO94_09560 [Opitutaceae bacterium]